MWQHDLQGVEGVTSIEEGINPATWLLEVTTPGMESTLGVSFAEYYASSDLAKYGFVCNGLDNSCQRKHKVTSDNFLIRTSGIAY